MEQKPGTEEMPQQLRAHIALVEVQFPPPTWHLAIDGNTSSTASNTLFLSPQTPGKHTQCTNRRVDKTLIFTVASSKIKFLGINDPKELKIYKRTLRRRERKLKTMSYDRETFDPTRLAELIL